VTPGGMYFLLLHDGRSEDSVRQYFTEIYDIYVKYMLNPFAKHDSPIVSRAFDSHTKMVSKRMFGF